MKRTIIAGLICAVGLCCQPAAIAKDKPGKGRPDDTDTRVQGEEGKGDHGHKDGERASEQDRARYRFSESERSNMKTYVTGYDNPKKLPPGLAKKLARGRPLPPGWQQKCVPGEILPQTVYARCQPLPPELVVKLPPTPMGTVTVAIGGKVVRLLEATREILDVFDVHVR